MTRGTRVTDGARAIGFFLLFLFLAGLFLARGSEAVVVQGAAMLLAALLATGVMVRTEGLALAAVGLPLTGAWSDLFRGLALGTLVAMLAVLLAAGAGGLRWERAPGGLIEYGATGLWTLAILLVPATAEEVVFRGYPMRTLARSWGPAMALMVTSAGFAALHGWNPEVGLLALGNIGLAGLFLGVLLLKTGSLWWASGAHAGWNVTSAYVADLPLSGLRIVDSPMLEVADGGRTWITGGSFGLEGGVAATVALCVGTAAVGLGRGPTPSRAAMARGSLAPLAKRSVPVVVGGNSWALEEE